jgi:LPS-assembly protein
VERLDFRPELSLPLSGDGWHTLTSVAVRETFASRSRTLPIPPVELTNPINRASVELSVDARPPAIERDFTTPHALARLLGPRVRHTVEPEFTYRYTAGISNFLSLLRFDDRDVDSNTNELQFGVTQRLYASPKVASGSKAAIGKDARTAAPCAAAASADATTPTEPDAAPSGLDANGIPTAQAPPEPTRTHAGALAHCTPSRPQQQEWLSWRLSQKHFFDPYFGGAVVTGRRNLLETTLNFSGIAFLTEPRDISPLLSRFRMRTSSHTDIEWNFDLDTGAAKFTSSNIYIDAHEGPIFGAVSYARLNAPGRFYTETFDDNSQNTPILTSSATSDFSQLRFLLGYGTPAKPGFSTAANAGIDLNAGSLQYGSLQGSYNWNCCGISVEYRKYELGSVRNEGVYRFNLTLANIGTAGNLRRSDRLF